MLHSRGKDLLFADGGLVVLMWSEISHSPHLSSPLSTRCWPAASPSLGLLTASGPEAGPMASAAGMVKAVLNSVCGGRAGSEGCRRRGRKAGMCARPVPGCEQNPGVC